MPMFLLIALLCLLITVLPDFIRNYLKVSRFFKGTNTNEVPKHLQAALDKALENLEDVRNGTHSGEYARSIKIMRAEEKVNVQKTYIAMAKRMASLKQSSIDTIACYGFKLLLTLVLFIVSMLNRSTPVMTFDESFNLQPLVGFLSFPTGVPNAISVPIWAFTCNFTFRLLYGSISKRA